MDLCFIPRIIANSVIWGIKNMRALNACGTSMDPVIIPESDDVFHVEIHVQPGKDEVVFTELKIPNCQIALADMELSPGDCIIWRPVQSGEFRDSKIPVRLIVPPESRGEKPELLHALVRIPANQDSIRIILSGGWLRCLSTTRAVPKN